MKFFKFMALPRELRENIYKNCLIVPGNVVHYPEYYSYDQILEHKDRKLTEFLSLLFLSKQIHGEAAPVFYAKNDFRVTATAIDLKNGGMVNSSVDWSWYDSLDWDEPYHIDNVWVRKGHLIRHATVYFHQQDLDPQKVILRTQEAHESQLLTGAECRDLLHEENEDAMFDIWRFKGAAFSHLTNLATLDIDIKWLYCPMGCCRDGMVLSLWDALTDFLDFLPADLKIRIHGVHGKIENDSAEEWCLAMQEARRKYKVGMEKAKAEKEEAAKAELEEAEAKLEELRAELQELEAKLKKLEAEHVDATARFRGAKVDLKNAKANMEETMNCNDALSN